MEFMKAITANKKAIIKRALIIGGTLAGLVLVMKVIPKTVDEFEMPEAEAEDDDIEENEEI